MEGVEVRPANEQDVPAINEIHGHYALTTAISFDVEPWSVEQRACWLLDHPPHGPHRAVVAVSDDVVVGWASTSPFASKVCYSTSVECSVLVRHGCTSRGVGTAMYRYLFDALAGEDIHRMYAGVTLPNDASIALHERFGFVQVAYYREVGRKFDRYHDVVWFERPA
jgi:phosphinothricin acetyltransferase